jgi:hypothetical protein
MASRRGGEAGKYNFLWEIVSRQRERNCIKTMLLHTNTHTDSSPSQGGEFLRNTIEIGLGR